MKRRDKTHELVKKAYGKVAAEQSSCCVPSSGCGCGGQPTTVPGHPVPEAELGLSCGNPLAFGYIRTGDVVLDLGSGAGKDVFLAAQRVGNAGKVVGVDFTPEMLALARKNAAKFFESTGLANVEFREGTIEDLPIEDGSVDVVISNCVINLSPDKPKAFREVYRVLKPDGRMVISDIVLNRPLPPELHDDAGLYAACIAGAALRDEYLQTVRAAGFIRVDVIAEHVYTGTDADHDPITGRVGASLEGIASSITVLATK